MWQDDVIVRHFQVGDHEETLKTTVRSSGKVDRPIQQQKCHTRSPCTKPLLGGPSASCCGLATGWWVTCSGPDDTPGSCNTDFGNPGLKAQYAKMQSLTQANKILFLYKFFLFLSFEKWAVSVYFWMDFTDMISIWLWHHPVIHERGWKSLQQKSCEDYQIHTFKANLCSNPTHIKTDL